MVFKTMLKWPKVCQTPPPHTNTPPLLPAWTVETTAFMFFTTKYWPDHLNVSADSSRFSNLLVYGFGDPVWSVSSVCCSYLTGAAPGVVFCCWSPSASGFHVLCVQRWCSADLGCNSYCYLSIISNQSILLWPLTSTRHVHDYSLFRPILCKP